MLLTYLKKALSFFRCYAWLQTRSTKLSY